MTLGVQSTVEAWTGDRPITCPWRAFFDPFVQRVTTLHRAFEKGQLHVAAPHPSARTVEGVLHYQRAIDSCEVMRMKQEQERRKS